jgi:3-dehydroquinate dehydratase / shikimate dehydrogenase
MEIIASYVPRGAGDPRQELGCPPSGATMIELRADLLGSGVSLGGLVAASPLPVLLTLRSRAEGGAGPDGAGDRAAFFREAAASAAALIDVEAERDFGVLDGVVPRERAVLSIHGPAAPCHDLRERTARLLEAGTRLAKVAPEVRNLADLVAVLGLAQEFDRGKRGERRAVVLAMGEVGRAARLLGPLLAAPVAYVAWAAGRSAAEGQYTVEELLQHIGHLAGRPRRLFAVLGERAAMSWSPRMHNAAYRALELPHLFVPLPVASAKELGALLVPSGRGPLDAIGLAVGGYAVTMPWKEAAAARCDLVAPRAARAYAVNTVLARPGKTLGDLTDIDGISRVVHEAGVDLTRARAVILGTGGAARAAAVALNLAGAAVGIVGRDAAKAADVASRLGVAACTLGETQHADVVVNATPLGLDAPPDLLLDGVRAPAGALVVDLPYGEAPTRLAELAAARGWSYVDGREVLLYQGVSQFAAMNGAAPPVRAMAGALGLEGAES